MIVPRALRPGAVIGLVAPSSPQRDESRLERGIRYLESLGYRVQLGQHAHRRYRDYLAGTDAERCADLEEMFSDPGIDAIFCTRGGYGSARLLPLLNLDVIRRNPKIFVGFSDVTALQLALWKRLRFVTFSGALPSVDMADGFFPAAEQQFWEVLTRTSPGMVLRNAGCRLISKGNVEKEVAASGTLLPANLAMLCSLAGTTWLPSFNRSIIVLEDVGEEPYRIDRLLLQLRLLNVPQRVAATVFGHFTPSPGQQQVSRDVLKEWSEVSSGPVMSGFWYGHEREKFTVPVGIRATLTTHRPHITFQQAAVC